MEIPVELVRILINEGGETQVIVVREVDGDRELPISIGFFEAAAIDRRTRIALGGGDDAAPKRDR